MAQEKKKEKLSRVLKPKFAKDIPKPVQALNTNGQIYLDAIDTRSVVIATGPAGVGKTYMSVVRATELLERGDFHKIIITRPNVQMGKSLGFLPGEAHEKLNPYIAHIKSIITDCRGRDGSAWLECKEKKGNIQFVDMAYCQGHTYDNAIIIVDEAENLSPKEAYILLTRIGEHSIIILNGDIRQQFSAGASGLPNAIHVLRNVEGVQLVEFTSSDIVRSGIVKEIVKAYERE